MSEGGDTPSADEVVQSTPMASLNEETTPMTDDKKCVFQRVGSMIGGKKSKDKAAIESTEGFVTQLTKELVQSRKECDRYKVSEVEKKELIMNMDFEAKLQSAEIEKLEARMEYDAKLKDKEIENLKIAHLQSETEKDCEIKLKSAEIDSLKRESDILNEKLQVSRDEIDRYKSELDSKESRLIEMDKESNSKSEEIETLKIAHQKFEAETESLITRMECEAKLRSAEIEKFKRESDILNKKLHTTTSKVDRCKNELDSNAARMAEMADEIKSKSVEIEKLEAKMENELKLKDVEIENLKIIQSKAEADIKSKSDEIEKLKRKSENETGRWKNESDNLRWELRASRDNTDRYSRDLEAKKTEMDIELKSKAKEIECLQKTEAKLNSRISMLEKKVEAAKNGENLKISGDVTRGFENVEKNLRSLLDRPTEMTIRWIFAKISKLTAAAVFSHSVESAGINWRIRVENCDGHLGFYLEGKKFGAVKWSFAVLAHFQLLSRKDDSIIKYSKFVNPIVYHEAENTWGKPKFIPFQELLKGDAVKDDSIIVAVDVKVFPSN